MNYFAHAYRYLEDPYFVAGSGVPDWLSVVDRRVRVRIKTARPFENDPDRLTAAVARGIVRHIEEDAIFHGTRAFAELCLELTVTARRELASDSGFRPSFLGHLLVEVLLDASLIGRYPERLEEYYRMIDSVDADRIQEAVNRMARGRTELLAPLIRRFNGHRILSDYAEDDKLFLRLNQVMRRVKCDPLPEAFCRILPKARRQVEARADELMEGLDGL